ncbi:hypothetical protein B0H17DRAFT_1337186 [Mycena rosella]|uniref:DUF7918 domain-containing protein n=1 Tax=Mycena rosella TaxID=1033263 RepID=A0AAD7CSJ8_MYCRO|nr:hypothetical protein B0H17DRAFT_1337186 [Mycena rosella]
MLHWKDPEFSAWITLDGIEAPEYAVTTYKDEGIPIITCCLASESGKKMSVNWTNMGYAQPIIGIVTFDGKDGGNTVIFAPFDFPESGHVDGITNRRGTTIKPFRFKSLELTDNETCLNRASPEKLGLIELTIKSAEIKKNPKVVLGHRAVMPLRKITLHERSKKAATQNMQILLGDSEQLAERQIFIEYPDEGPELVKFCFKYYPLGVLQANGIAPFPPQIKREASAERERALASADTEEAKILAERARTLRGELRAVEAELAKLKKGPAVKREFEAGTIDLRQLRKKVKTDSAISGEIIDLTMT